MKKSKKDFDIFISQLSETNANLGFFCDFDKISANVSDIAISLNTLNYLLGKKDLRYTEHNLFTCEEPTDYNLPF